MEKSSGGFKQATKINYEEALIHFNAREEPITHSTMKNIIPGKREISEEYAAPLSSCQQNSKPLIDMSPLPDTAFFHKEETGSKPNFRKEALGSP